MATKNSIKKANQDPLLSALGDLKELFPDLADEKVLNESSSTNKEIVDIITFCEHPRLLGLPDANLPLFPAQKIILKT